MSELDKSRAAHQAAITARVAVEGERNEERRLAVQQVEVQIEAKFVDRIRAARNAEAEAERALIEEKIRAGVDANADMVTGVLVKWEKRYMGTSRKWCSTNARGRYEIRTGTSMFHSNKIWGLPDYGEKFIRLLKNDGSDGLGFESLNRNVWLPEGESPPEDQQ